MNEIAKISCYLERSVVTLKLRKEYLITVTHNTLWSKNCHHFSFHCSFYKCWPISVIFGTHYIELICNTTVIDLFTYRGLTVHHLTRFG